MEEEPNREIKRIRLIMPNFDENQKEILKNAIKAANKDGIEVEVKYPLPSSTPDGDISDLTLSNEEQKRIFNSIVNEGIEGIEEKIGKECSGEKCDNIVDLTDPENIQELKEMGIITGGKKKKRSKKRKSLKKKRKTKKKVVKKKKATKKKTKKGKK